MNHGKLLFEESEKSFNSGKWNYLGQVIMLFLLGMASIYLAISRPNYVFWYIIGFMLIGFSVMLLWIYYVSKKTAEKFKIYEDGINPGDTRDKFFIPFEKINKVERSYSRQRRLCLKLFLNDGNIIKIGSHRAIKDTDTDVLDIESVSRIINEQLKLNKST